MEASAHLLSVISPYEFCGSGPCFRGSSTLWTTEPLLLIPPNVPPVEVAVTLSVLITYTEKPHKNMNTYTYVPACSCKYIDINGYVYVYRENVCVYISVINQNCELIQLACLLVSNKQDRRDGSVCLGETVWDKIRLWELEDRDRKKIRSTNFAAG